uniref:Uncharacterized protein n=1 Tax=Glossina brevipalpis TaxID=37001 RepID=A0A1A9WJ20_9MUSC
MFDIDSSNFGHINLGIQYSLEISFTRIINILVSIVLQTSGSFYMVFLPLKVIFFLSNVDMFSCHSPSGQTRSVHITSSQVISIKIVQYSGSFRFIESDLTLHEEVCFRRRPVFEYRVIKQEQMNIEEENERKSLLFLTVKHHILTCDLGEAEAHRGKM